MHPLFEAPATDVTLDMVQDFVNLKIREGLTVEYKRAGDKPIEAVAALANTYGGLLLVGVAEEEKGVPSEIVGAPLGEKEKLINQMATRFDPPWTPEVIEVPYGGAAGDKVVLVVRIDRATVPRPVVLDGSIFVRLDARNAKANRQMMRMLLDEPAVQAEPTPMLARHGLKQYGSPFRDDGNDPDVALRAVSTMALWRGEERTRFPSGLAGEVVKALQETRAQPLLSRLSFDLLERRQALTAWELVQATSRRLLLRMSTIGTGGSTPSRPGAQMVCRVALDGDGLGAGLEVVFDTCVWLPEGVPLGLDYFVQVMYDSVPIVANTILPMVAAATVGIKAMPTPVTEIHTAVREGRDTYGDSVSGSSLDKAVSLGSLGDKTGDGTITQGGEVLLRSLVNPPRWDEAVREALVTMAMDWGFPDPKLP
ncbi:ATP-binding protein [Streptomyces sp. PTM05]|uniref:ATP-binding protein n=1 Tax=Streptantibioticus parmotrematis TaxID=2873249 RepID=A0ABS7R1S5_9ACTN|nr:ATP-binding protein [Streptantibioticus parmotrematis]MBY8889423.1 ATP-binding protein [Streptantibioticus parmotrematis]